MSGLYQTKEWKHLNLTDRIYLLLTTESVRPGTVITPSHVTSNLEHYLNEKDMKLYKEDKLWYISKNKSLLNTTVIAKTIYNNTERFFTPKEKHKYAYIKAQRVYHKIMGEFFGYPNCCINEFANVLLKGILPNMEWRKKAWKALQNGEYNDMFDYLFYVPCGISCKKSLKDG